MFKVWKSKNYHPNLDNVPIIFCACLAVFLLVFPVVKNTVLSPKSGKSEEKNNLSITSEQAVAKPSPTTTPTPTHVPTSVSIPIPTSIPTSILTPFPTIRRIHRESNSED